MLCLGGTGARSGRVITFSGGVSVVLIAIAAVTVVYLLVALLDPERF